MKTIIFVTTVITVFLFACSPREAVRYEGIEVPVKDELKGELLNTTFLFSFPKEMLIVDSFLIVRDFYNQDTCFHIFDKNDGRYLGGFGAKGRGPGEVLFPATLCYNRDAYQLQTYDPNLKKIVNYNIHEKLSGKNAFFSEMRLNKGPDFLLDVNSYKNTPIVRSNTDMRFGVMSRDSGIICKYSHYPDIGFDSELNRAVFNYAPRCALRPEQDKMVLMTYIGGIVEIFSLKEGKIIPLNVNYFYKPVFREVEGIKPKWIAAVEETVVGCDNIYATNDYIYTVYRGEVANDEKVDLRKIIVFDWEGKPLFRYNLKEGIPQAIAVDEKYIYCVVSNENYEYQLYKYTYKD